ncbi:CrcB family protein [Arthrobacter sp. JSM 101049]|uniref:fluoride efflux transporter FluC n=1 Tax=Arthrobacter sp. JSM 101049 TaxID=929097 RepID=UPI003562ECE6
MSGPDPHPELPVDADTDALEIPPRTTRRRLPGQTLHPRPSDRPLHLSAPHVGLVLLGGFFGTASREGLTLAVPGINGLPTTILAVNIVGAFLLGLLLESLLRAGDDAGARRTLRLMLGTGFLGGFTTYSTFAVDAMMLGGGAGWGSGAGPGAGVLLVLATVLVGAAASWAGIALASLLHRREARR